MQEFERATGSDLYPDEEVPEIPEEPDSNPENPGEEVTDPDQQPGEGEDDENQEGEGGDENTNPPETEPTGDSDTELTA